MKQPRQSTYKPNMELWVSHKYLRGSQSEYLGETIHESDLEKLLVEFCVKNGNCL